MIADIGKRFRKLGEKLQKRAALGLSLIGSLRFLAGRGGRGRKTVLVMVHAVSGGGAERVASILASELTARYHVLLLYFFPRENEYPVSTEVERICIPWGRMYLDDRFGRWIARYVRLLKKRRRVDLSISFLFAMNALNAESRAADRVILCERNNPVKSRDAVRFDRITELYRRADHVVFQSAAVRGLFPEEVKAHSTILPNPVSVSCLRSGTHPCRIVTAGRLHPQKDHAMLITAFGRFYKDHPAYRLSIYGEGEMRDELEARIAALGLSECVRLEGRSETVQADMADAGIFVLSSAYEGLSNALLEAMMMGFPCISTDCEGSVDVIEDGVNGLLVPRGDAEAMADALRKLAEDPVYREQLGKKAKETGERFRKDRVVREWEQLIEQVCADGLDSRRGGGA